MTVIKEILFQNQQCEFGLIPGDWLLCTFKDVLTTFSSGATPYRGISEYYKGNIRWISSGVLDYNLITETIEHISSQAVKNTNLRVYPAGTFLMAITGLEAEGTRGRCAIVGASSATNQSCLAINGTEKMCVEYLFWFYRMWGQYLAFKYCQGTKQQSYTADIVKKLPIYCPPTLQEQKAIAQALNDVDKLIVALDKKIEKKRLIKQGAMQQLLTGKKRLREFTEVWKEIEFAEVYKYASEGGTPETNNDLFYKNGNIPFVKVEDTIRKYITSVKSYITKAGLSNSSAWLIPENSIIFTNGATIGNVSINKIPVSTKQGILGIIPDSKVNVEFLYYFLSHKEFQNEVRNRQTKGTFATIILKSLSEIPICIPALNEQTAIATILSDIDKEIANLEARRDKYRLIKKGMMQKLLTGQIRLVKPQTKSLAKVRRIPVAAHIIAGHIVNSLYGSKGWGRTKLQKSIHLIGYCCQLDFGNDYIQNTAGPDDQILMNYIDAKFRQYRHVRIVKQKDSQGRWRYDYRPNEGWIEEVEIAFENYPSDIQDKINALLAKIKSMDLGRAEIISTLYAVWNNRIIKNEPITDTLLLEDFYAWSKHKLDFNRELVFNGLKYMRKESIVPTGWGKYIDKKE